MPAAFMATIPRNPDTLLLDDADLRVAAQNNVTPRLPDDKHDALQALLAFSALHAQVRARRASAASSSSLGNASDQFVLYEVLQLVSERALKLTGADGIAIALVQEGEIICRAATGSIAPQIGARLDPHSGLSGACFRTAEIVRCDDAETDPRVNVQASRQLRARSMIAVPLRGRRSVIGLIEAFCKDAYAFDDSDARSLTLLSELILGAMKPEEEERLEALSPVSIPQPQPFEEAAVEVEPPGPADLELIFPETEQADAPAQIAPAQIAPAQIEPAAVAPAPPAALPPASPARYWVAVAGAVGVTVAAAAISWWNFQHRAAQPVARTEAPLIETSEAPQLQTTSQPATAVPDGASTTLGSLLSDSSPAPEQDALRGVLPQITGIRHWESEDSSTVVIDLQDQVQYEVHRLTSPERIYFDLHDTALAQSLNGKTIEVGDQLLARIRVAQPFPGVSRVVLETRGVSNFSVGLEPNPYRLSIEISRISTRQKSRTDMLQTGTATEENTRAVPAPMSKEDRALRARVPHMKIVLDAGHGGWDLGAVGQRGLVEKDLVLDVVQRLGTLLQTRLGTDVVYTRDDDLYVPLEQRAEMANEAQADLFVSIHGNNSDYPSARGVETYYTSGSAPANSLEIEKRENSTAKAPATTPVLTAVTLKERTAESRRLAASVERALYGSLSSKNPGLRDRGVKDAGFVVLTNTSMPAILAEISFVSSPKDERQLQSSAYRQGIAEALYKGIMRYAAAGIHLKLASARGGSR